MAKKKKNKKPQKRLLKKTPQKKPPLKKKVKASPKKSAKKISKKVVNKNPVTKKKLPSKKQSKSHVETKRGAGFASNNFNYIRALIWREYGLDYDGYSDPAFIKIVRGVYTECKARQRECSDNEIFVIFDEIRQNPRRDEPFIDEDLYRNPRAYYELLSVDFSAFESYLWIVSPMIIPSPSEFIMADYFHNYTKLKKQIEANPDSFKKEVKKEKKFLHLSDKQEKKILEISNKEKLSQKELDEFSELYSKWRGTIDRGYRRYFKEFVDWANRVTRERSASSIVDSEEIEIFIQFTKPEYDEQKERWFTEIFICTATGQRFSFGFEPKGLSFDHDTDEEFIEAKEKEVEKEVDKEKKEEPEIKLTPEQIEKRKKANENLFSALLNLNKRYGFIEKKIQREKNKKKKVKTEQAFKEKELKRLVGIKKEMEKSIKFYKSIKDKKRMNKTLNDLDVIVNKIKKLS